MPGKETIVEELGELLLPNLVNQGLLANDRAKYLMTLLQTAREHADHPEDSVADLTQERVACGISDCELDGIVQGSGKEAPGRYHIPQAGKVHALIIQNLQRMLAPLVSAAGSIEGIHASVDEYQRRLIELSGDTLGEKQESVSGNYIDQITSLHPTGGDSLHTLVMHLHKELNHFQRQIAAESIDGASVYGIVDSDRPRIVAFMRGIAKTRGLKFDHPGLDTTVTRNDDTLIIQNDIGTTDAHVLVIRVSQNNVSVNYTDVHMQRLLFFQGMLRSYDVRWEDTLSRNSSKFADNLYHLSVGRFEANSENALQSYLEYLGSRLVFLIDWNKARKRLRKLAPKRIGMEVLQWAADNQLGHMAFLKLGGDQLVFDALQMFSAGRLQVGGQLSDIIGIERAAEFLKFTVRTCAEGLVAGHSELLIRDQVRAELRQYMETAHQGFLELAADHAALIVELATTAKDCLTAQDISEDSEFSSRIAKRAKKWEHRADELVSKARAAADEHVESRAAGDLLRIADDAADELDEGIFLLTLLDKHSSPEQVVAFRSGQAHDVLRDLADLVVLALREYVKAVENGRHIHRGCPREDMEDFLTAVDQTIRLEHEIDDAHRRSRECIFDFVGDFRQLHLFTEITDKLENASDAMMRAALTLKDYVLRDVISR